MTDAAWAAGRFVNLALCRAGSCGGPRDGRCIAFAEGATAADAVRTTGIAGREGVGGEARSRPARQAVREPAGAGTVFAGRLAALRRGQPGRPRSAAARAAGIRRAARLPGPVAPVPSRQPLERPRRICPAIAATATRPPARPASLLVGRIGRTLSPGKVSVLRGDADEGPGDALVLARHAAVPFEQDLAPGDRHGAGLDHALDRRGM